MATLPTKVWTRLIGAGGNDNALAITIGLDGCIYLCGGTNGSLDGQVNNGGYDAFVTKYNPDGTKVWTRLLCTINDETAFALTVGIDGSIYVCGGTFGPLDGQANNGGKDAFVAKFNPDGTKVWTRLLGTSGKEVGYSLTTGLDGAVYVSGDTEGALEGQTNNGAHDVFVTKFNPDGTKVWTRLLGTGSDEGVKALTTGSDGFIYVSGYTGGSLDGQTSKGGNDAFVTKYNPDGTKVWTRLLGSSSDDVADALTTGLDGSIYVSGYTGGLIDGQSNSGIWDAFVSKYNPDGTKVWTRTLGTSSYDEATALTTGLDGFIFVSGYTGGSLDGQASNGGYDAFLTQYNPDGTKVWTRLLGNSSDEFAYAIAKGFDGTIYVSGIADGSLDGQINGGSFDGFTVKYQVLAAAPTFSISATSPSINEGNTATFTLKTSGLASGTAVTYTLSGISAADITGGQLTGIAVINSIGTATISVPIAADVLNDSGEILTITVQGATASLLINDTSFSLATFSLVTETLAVNEGSTAIVTLSTTNVSAGTSVPYTLSGNRITTSDISSGQLNGTAIVGVTGKATIAIPIAADQTTEGPETITLTAQGVSASIVINDTSLTPAIFVVDTGFSVTQSNQTIYGGADTAVIWINKGAYSKVYAYNSATSQTTIQPNGQLVDFIGDTFVYGNTQTSNTRLNLSFIGNQSPVTVDARNFHTTGIVTTNVGANFVTDHVAEFQYESGSADTILSSGSYESYSGYRDGSNSGNNTNGAGLTIVFPKSFASYSIVYAQTSANDPSGNISVQDQSIPIFGNGWADSRVILRGAKTLVFADKTITIGLNGQPVGATTTYTISSDGLSVNEGGIATFTLITTNVVAGTLIPYVITGNGTYDTSITSDDLVGGRLSGNLVVGAQGSATLEINLANDFLTEGRETLTVSVSGTKASVLVNDTSPAIPMSIVAGSNNYDEGSTAVFYVTVAREFSGLAIPYKVSGLNAADVSGGVLTGSSIINSNGTATIYVTLVNDLLTEGPETLYLAVTAGGAGVSVIVNDTSVSALSTTSYSVTANGSSVNEGEVATLTLTTTNVAAGTSVPYTLSGVGITSGDIFGGQLGGSAVVDSTGKATISIPIASDGIPEGSETLVVTVAGRSASVLITDASTVLVPTYALSAANSSVNEGASVIFTLTTNNVAGGTALTYTLSGTGITANDIFGGALTGTAVIDSTGRAIISVPISSDLNTEGAETLTITVQGATASVQINDTSATLASTYVLTAGAASVNEGSIATFTLTTVGVAAGSSVPYTLSGTGINSSDIVSGQLSGTAVVDSSGKATISVPIAADQNTEGAETLAITVQGATASVIINDTSTSNPTYALTSGASSVNEGSTAIFTLTTANVPPLTAVSYTLSGTGIASADISNLVPGQPVIDLGAYGKLILPVQVDGGKWFYYWDASGDGTGSDGQADFKTPAYLYSLFTQDLNGNVQASGRTTEIYRYATLNGVKVALPTLGAIPPYTVHLGTSVGSSIPSQGSNTINTTYDDYLAIWDAYNGTGSTANVEGTPPGWSNGQGNGYVAVPPTGVISASMRLTNNWGDGGGTFSNPSDPNWSGVVALQVVFDSSITVSLVSGVLTGTAIVDSSGRATVSIPIAADQTTEGRETLIITAQGATASVQINDTSVSLAPAYLLTATSLSVNEGAVATLSLTTTNVAAGSSVTFTLSGVGISSGDVVGGQLSGSVVIDSAGKATIQVSIASDGLLEGPETLLVTVGGKSASILINDTGISKAGTAGADSLVGSVGSDTIDGGGGVDTVFYSGNQGTYNLSRGATWVVSSLAEGVDNLSNIERLHFADMSLALDMGITQPSGQAAVLLGAVLPGKLALDASKQALMGAVIGLIDQGYSLTVLAGALLRLDIWTILTGSNTNQAIANYLLTNVNGVAPDATSLANGVNALNTEPVQGTWLAALAGGSAGQSHIGLSALAQTGLAFIAPEAITPSVQSINEGDTINFALTTNLPQGTSLPYTLSGTGLTGADITGGALSGTVTVNAYGQANVPVGIVADSLTEGAETLVFTSRGLSASVVINDTSVLAIPTYAITAGVANVNEGGTVTFTVSTTNVAAGTVIPYTLSGTGINGLDIAGGQLSGSAVITQSGSAVITVTVASDVTTEGPETLIATVAGKTAQIVINDTSMAAATYRILLSALTVFGGDTLVVTLKTTNLTAGTRVPYSLTVPVLDIVGGTLSGDFIVDASGSASINIATTLHQTTDNLIINVVDQQQTVILVGVKGG